MQVEVVDEAEGFKFRLVDGNDASPWCCYVEHAYLKGTVAATQYYLSEALALKPITPDEFCKATARQ